MKRNNARWDLDRVRYHLNKRPAPQREIRPLTEILSDVMEGMEQPMDENIVVLREAWPKMVGPQIAQHSEPVRIEFNALVVSVDLPGFMPELQRIKLHLLKKLKCSYRELRIRQLRFELLHK